ncbi:Protein of unknown function UPF0025 [Candidatus Koribacter versatilis Ellin345]|uniref:Phosphoesterase n=1 Tax=Koribacter versatilis (strain Ellin345) TaxID=204669 RepID=Q1ISZ7_KORVE|nr:metallophosphoesterase family protein [Candidatus Koribacter versatilis]ABF40003.1 Protein of unknown function UPF0025 [Candidatus Koribacter versatilis Ellin345]
MKIGVISDTHGLLRPQAVSALEGVDHILHAGDIGNIEIVAELRNLAPVTAIRGNVDTHRDYHQFAATDAVELGGKLFYLIHNVKELDVVPGAAGIAAVIYGHSHKPEIRWEKDVLFFNPGAAGPRRFYLPIAVGIIQITAAGKLKPRIIELSE